MNNKQSIFVLILVLMMIVIAAAIDFHITLKKSSKCKESNENLVLVYGRVYSCGGQND